MDDEALFKSALLTAVAPLGVTLHPHQVESMWRHFRMLIEANRRVNLTRITDPVKAAVKHYADSLAVAGWLQATSNEVTTLLDVGTGGGFPAIPLAIYGPHWRITAIDGTGKKLRCAADFVARLGLTNCTLLHRRAEKWPEDVPKFDLILFRAIAPIADCLKLARPFCVAGSIVVCYKTDPLARDEHRDAEKSARGLGYDKLAPWAYSLICANQRLSHQLCSYHSD